MPLLPRLKLPHPGAPSQASHAILHTPSLTQRHTSSWIIQCENALIQELAAFSIAIGKGRAFALGILRRRVTGKHRFKISDEAFFGCRDRTKPGAPAPRAPTAYL